MINITDKSQCCGCNACGDVCAHNAITFKTDIEGFWYPEVDREKCTDCGLCEKVCPILKAKELKKNEFEQAKCFASVHKNLEVRFDSTSGGLFSAFAEQILKEGGVVGGAIYNDDLTVRQVLIDNKLELHKLRGSKYLQSDFTGFYKSVKDYLKEGRKVLICGSPCQMAAIRSYLRKDYENLFILDYICRGIPSTKIFMKYLQYWEEKMGSKVVSFKFKIKDLGWRQRTMRLGFKNGKFAYDPSDKSLYDLGYHRTHIFCRPSCYDCKFIGFPRIADVTIADFWGVEKVTGPELDRDMGTSLVMCNNSKGYNLFQKLSTRLESKEVPFESILQGNPALLTSHPAPKVDRASFYRRLDVESFDALINDVISKTDDISCKYIKHAIKRHVHAARFMCNVIKAGPKSLCQYFKYNHISSILGFNKGIVIPLGGCVLDVHKRSDIHVCGNLRIGYKRVKGSNLESRLLLEEGAKLDVKGDYIMYYGADVEVFQGATLTLGNNSGFNINGTIICGDSITIGDNVAMGRNVTIRDTNGGHYISRQGYKNTRPVVIEDHAWLCEGCTIMPGVKVGMGAIVGAGSIVYTNVPPFTMVSGNPAKVIDKNIYWKL